VLHGPIGSRSGKPSTGKFNVCFGFASSELESDEVSETPTGCDFGVSFRQQVCGFETISDVAMRCPKKLASLSISPLVACKYSVVPPGHVNRADPADPLFPIHVFTSDVFFQLKLQTLRFEECLTIHDVNSVEFENLVSTKSASTSDKDTVLSDDDWLYKTITPDRMSEVVDVPVIETETFGDDDIG